MNYKFIAFEGIDGSGKTTLAKALAKECGGIYYFNPPQILRDLRSFADKSTPEVRYQYYLLGNIVASEEIKGLLSRNHTIADWYVFGTLAYHAAMGVETSMPKKILFPDLIVYTKSSFETIKKRIQARQERSKYETSELLHKAEKEYEKLIEKRNDVLIVHTDNSSVSELISIIIERLRIK